MIETLTIAFGAFLGGMALNLMPCVLPIISIKLWHLIEVSGKSYNIIRKELFIYSLGLIFTFIVLGLIVYIFQQLGYFLCWGFHLQSPLFVFIIGLLMVFIGINLMGVFEIGTKFSGKMAAIQHKLTGKVSESTNSFLSGVFTTLVATPCSGPLLASAIGYSLLGGPWVASLIFLMGGIGVAFPFIVIGLFPKLLKFVPKPGKWMVYFKIFLGMCAILSSSWFFWLFYNLI